MSKKYQPVGVGMTPCRTELGSFIRARRLELKLRQVLLSELVGFSQNLVSMFEVGVCKHLNEGQLQGLAKALQCDPEELRKRLPEKRTAKPTTELGKMIQSRREELGMTPEDIATKLGITCKQAKCLEIRRSPALRYPAVKPLAEALKLEVTSFAKFVGSERKAPGGELGLLVRQRRKELAMSLTVLANKLGVTRQFVNYVESGQCRLSTSDDMIERLAEVLRLDVNQLNAIRPRRKLRIRKSETAPTPLSEFLVDRRSELRLTQREVSDRSGVSTVTISDVEGGIVHPTPNVLGRLAKALECEVPPELVPEKKRTEHAGLATTVRVLGRARDDMDKIKGLTGIKSGAEIVGKALELLRRLLEKQQDGFVIYVVKGGDVVKFDILP